MKEKNLSIELIKFLAVIFVANHWMAPLYVKWSYLATGGAIGDVLFFFASGFTLFLGRFGRFDNWYKRRIKRIFPSVIALSIVLSLLGIRQFTAYQMIFRGGDNWFIRCIMIYYIVLFFVRKYAEHKPMIPFVISIIIILLWYIQEDSSHLFMYGNTYFKWGHYFLFMLLGAYLGNKTIQVHSKPHVDLIQLITCIIVFYGIQILANKFESISHFQILTLLPLLGIVLTIYKLCSTESVNNMMKSKMGLCLRFISGLCLEVYLVSFTVINFMKGKFVDFFPSNLFITFILIVVAAYLIRCLARIFTQIFDKEEFDWMMVFRLVD